MKTYADIYDYCAMYFCYCDDMAYDSWEMLMCDIAMDMVASGEY